MKRALWKLLLMFCLCFICPTLPALSQEAYKFVDMWPPHSELRYFCAPSGVALDSSRNLFVADSKCDRIQKLDPNGRIITQWGSQGTGDGQFDGLTGVAVHPSGNVYVVEAGNNRIQKFDSNGRFITKWGSPGIGNGQFNRPWGVAVDASGFVYVADTDNHRIQKFGSNGRFVAKWGSFGEGDGQFKSPLGLAVDPSGNVYATDSGNFRVQKFDSNGTFMTKWGSYGTGNGEFRFPIGVAIAPSGFVFVAEWSNERIQKFDSNGNFISKVTVGYNARGVAVDSSGNTYITSDYYDRILKLDSNGSLIAKWYSWSSEDGRFDRPGGLTVDELANVYVADSGNNRIQKLDQNGNFIAKWYTNYGNTGPDGVTADVSDTIYAVISGINTTPISAPPPPMPSVMKFGSDGNLITNWGSFGTGDSQFSSPMGIGADTSGNVYVADTWNHRIQKFDGKGYFITKWGSYGSANGQFQFPWGVAIDQLGNVYVADSRNNRVQKFDSKGSFLTGWGSQGTGDGQFANPLGVAVDSTGNIYVADTDSSRIQKFDTNGNFITKWGSFGTGGGQFNRPEGLAVDSLGNVYVADTFNHRIQKFSPNLGPQENISIPNTPGGPIDGIVGTDYTYSTGGSSSNLEHPIEYRFYWGDGTYSEWSASASSSKTWSSPGTYPVRAKARCASHTIFESDWSEGLEVSVNPGDLPDLTEQWASFHQTCKATRRGQKCRIKAKLTIQNIGSQNAPSSFVRFYLSDDGKYDEGVDTYLNQVATGTIKAGKSKTKTLSYSFPLGETASSKYVIAVIDADNTVEESNENNNYAVFGPVP